MTGSSSAASVKKKRNSSFHAGNPIIEFSESETGDSDKRSNSINARKSEVGSALMK